MAGNSVNKPDPDAAEIAAWNKKLRESRGHKDAKQGKKDDPKGAGSGKDN